MAISKKQTPEQAAEAARVAKVNAIAPAIRAAVAAIFQAGEGRTTEAAQAKVAYSSALVATHANELERWSKACAGLPALKTVAEYDNLMAATVSDAFASHFENAGTAKKKASEFKAFYLAYANGIFPHNVASKDQEVPTKVDTFLKLARAKLVDFKVLKPKAQGASHGKGSKGGDAPRAGKREAGLRLKAQQALMALGIREGLAKAVVLLASEHAPALDAFATKTLSGGEREAAPVALVVAEPVAPAPTPDIAAIVAAVMASMKAA